ncbi:MAG: tail fiber domain-containing protein [Betaproteobacteria bacterium]|nr:tail fiber domain-containing protein [Betaproteobacteria bacterium]
MGGGFGNNVFDGYGTIGGGSGNQAGFLATAPGGVNNIATGAYSFAAGRGAFTALSATVGAARHAGTFLWADSNANGTTLQQFFSTAEDQFAVRARGGVAFRVASTTDANTGAGCSSCPPVARHRGVAHPIAISKEAISDISPMEFLGKVAALPLSTWSFKGTDRRHMGPMAQDFRAAFGLGVDDKNITTSDVGGVALAAIQGLYQLLHERDGEIARLKSNEQELAKLRRELTEIKSALGLK